MTLTLSTEKAVAVSLARDATAVDQTTTKEFDMTQCTAARPVKAPEGFTQATDEFAPDGLAGFWSGPIRSTRTGYIIEVTWTPECGTAYEVYRQIGRDGVLVDLDGLRELRDELNQVLRAAAKISPIREAA